MSAPVVYLSGPITGVKDYWKPFEEAEEKLASAGYAVINPAKLPEGMTRRQYMAINLVSLMTADAVLTLPGWDNSIGAVIEVSLARYWVFRSTTRLSSWPRIEPGRNENGRIK